MNEQIPSQEVVSNQKDWSQGRIGRFAAHSILLVGIGAFVSPATPFVLLAVGIALPSNISYFSYVHPLMLSLASIIVATMLIAAVVVLLGHRRGEIGYRVALYSFASLLAYSAIYLPGDFSYNLPPPNSNTVISGIGPVQYALIRLFGYWPAGSIAYDVLLAIATIAIITAVYLIGRLRLLRPGGTIFLALTILSVAAGLLESVLSSFWSSAPGYEATNSGSVVMEGYVLGQLAVIEFFFVFVLSISCLIIYGMYASDRRRSFH